MLELKDTLDWRISAVSDLPTTPGIYCILCIYNNRAYIGGSINVKMRVSEHLRNMSMGPEYHSMYEDLQRYGTEGIEIRLLELVDNPSKLPECEAFWMKIYTNNSNKEASKRNRYW